MQSKTIQQNVKSWDQSQNKHFEGRTIFVGRRRPEISSGEGNEPIWKVLIQKEPLIANRKATCRLVTGMAH